MANKSYGGDKYSPKEGLAEGVPECNPIGNVPEHDTKGRAQVPKQPKKPLKTDRGNFTCY